MIRSVFRLSILLACFAAGSAWAQGTSEQRAACEGDAYRLCDAYIPDAYAVEKCLRSNMGSLSASCRREFGGGDGGGRRKSKRRR